MLVWLVVLFIGFGCFIQSAYAIHSGTGITLSTPLYSINPSDFKAYRAAVWYQPSSFIWGRNRIYLDGSFGHWWLNNVQDNRIINIYSIAPIYRHYFDENDYFSPFIDASIGFSYLSSTKIDSRNLGMHFSFQDQLGIGATLGRQQRLSISFIAMHYSNGRLSAHNAGITVPIVLNVSYRF